MCVELRGLHDRIGATTVYVTHDQIEAMAMADRIAVMNHGVVEQISSPQEIYDRPLTLHVAGFIGSPAMNFLRFTGGVENGAAEVRLGGELVAVPTLHEGVSEGELALGVRPEHVRLAADGGVRGIVFGAEYMGTLQVVTVDTAYGRVKARISSAIRARPGEPVGLHFADDRSIVFDAISGRALRSALFARAAA
jgi:multiple sugar transport system ATP-binding protein